MRRRRELPDAVEFVFIFIHDKKFNRNYTAIMYAQCMMQTTNPIDWPRINRAIMDRWSRSGLKYIKTKAWKILHERTT